MTNQTTEVSVREFTPGDESSFRKLNEAWITRYFALEPKDEIIFADPQSSILDMGGRIFFAVSQGEVVGCCALVAIGPGEFELAKMAVSESHQRAGIGRLLLQNIIVEARTSGAKRLYLETNRALTPAIKLYQSLGFRQLPPERVIASPYARADVFMELTFQPGYKAREIGW